MTLTAIRDSHIWVPAKTDIIKRAKKAFTIRIYDEKACNKCEYMPERHCDICDECEAFKGKYKLYKKKVDEKTGKTHIGLPVGKPSVVKKVVGEPFKVVRHIKKHRKFQHKIEFTGKLWGNQKQPVQDIIEAKRGILLSPPRSGKTVMAIKAICKLGYKALILAAQMDWLEQFMESFVGSKDVEPVTNIPDLQKFHGRKMIGICKTVEEMKKYDIVLATYQSFITDGGKKRLDAVKDLFGVVVIDEVHDTAADAYLRVILQLNPLYMFGLTGTYERKDGKIVLSETVIGTVKAIGKGDTDVPQVKMVETGVRYSGQHKTWNGAINWLSSNEQRNLVIVKHALKDLKAGRSIVIPVVRVNHARLLATVINKAWTKQTGQMQPIAAEFVGTLRKDLRTKVRKQAKSGKLRVIIGIRKIIQVGLNIPRWDMLYEVIPISNPPKMQQETARIRTKVEGKPRPIIKHFIEDFGVSRGCLRTCWWQTYKPLHFKIEKPDALIAAKYMMKGRQIMHDDSPSYSGGKVMW